MKKKPALAIDRLELHNSCQTISPAKTPSEYNIPANTFILKRRRINMETSPDHKRQTKYAMRKRPDPVKTNRNKVNKPDNRIELYPMQRCTGSDSKEIYESTSENSYYACITSDSETSTEKSVNTSNNSATSDTTVLRTSSESQTQGFESNFSGRNCRYICS